MNRLLHRSVSVLAVLASLFTTTYTTQTQAQTCPFDDGNSSIEVEGLILTRYALGLTGAPMVANTNINAVDAPTVEATISCPSCGLNITGNPSMTVADATIISRKLAGFRGAALTDSVALGSGTRNTPAAVQSFLLSGCGATGGTVTNVATSNGILGGPITATGTLSADTTFLQRRVASNCAAGSAINAIAADGTVTCAATGSADAFVQGGNSFGAPGVIGTNDAQPLTVKSGGTDIQLVNQRGDGLRVSYVGGTSPNAINGNSGNNVTAGVFGATIGGGGTGVLVNQVTGSLGVVAGGYGNKAGFAAVVSGGEFNLASGLRSTIAGGSFNTASGNNSLAAGSSAKADKDGAFVWSDASTGTPFAASVVWVAPAGPNTFNVRAVGGVMFATSVNASGAAATFCYMGVSGTGWICSSDRNVKERIEPITPSRVLAGVLAMPVSTWSIIGTKVRQMGPMAQDFYRAFGLGDTDKAINSIDSSGVAFAAIQGLNQKLTDEVRALRAKLATKDQEASQLKARLAAIEKKLGL